MFVYFTPKNVRCMNKEPEYDVTITCYTVELEKYQYKSGYGQDSFEVFERNMTVTITFMHKLIPESFTCDRMIEEFDKLILIKDFEQKEFEMKDIKEIEVRK